MSSKLFSRNTLIYSHTFPHILMANSLSLHLQIYLHLNLWDLWNEFRYTNHETLSFWTKSLRRFLTYSLMTSHSVSNIKHASLLNYSSSRNLQGSVSYEITQFPSTILYNNYLSLIPVTKRPAFVDFSGARQ